MRKRQFLGELELLVLLAVVRLGDDAYGVPIAHELVSITGSEISLGSIYATLERLARKSLVTGRVGDPTPERGGRAKRYYQVTEAGHQTLRETRDILSTLWNSAPALGGLTL